MLPSIFYNPLHQSYQKYIVIFDSEKEELYSWIKKMFRFYFWHHPIPLKYISDNIVSSTAYKQLIHNLLSTDSIRIQNPLDDDANSFPYYNYDLLLNTNIEYCVGNNNKKSYLIGIRIKFELTNLINQQLFVEDYISVFTRVFRLKSFETIKRSKQDQQTAHYINSMIIKYTGEGIRYSILDYLIDRRHDEINAERMII